MSKFNGFIDGSKIIQGTKKDFASAWLVRGAVLLLLGYTANQQHEQTVSMRAVATSSQSSNEAVIKIKADLDIRLPRIEQDIKTLNEKSAHAVTDDQLRAAEARQREEFTKLLKAQLKTKGRISPGTGAHDNIDDN